MMMVKQVRFHLNMITLSVLNITCATWRQNKAVQPTKVLALRTVYIRYLCGPISTIFDFSSSYADGSCNTCSINSLYYILSVKITDVTSVFLSEPN